MPASAPARAMVALEVPCPGWHINRDYDSQKDYDEREDYILAVSLGLMKVSTHDSLWCSHRSA